MWVSSCRGGRWIVLSPQMGFLFCFVNWVIIAGWSTRWDVAQLTQIHRQKQWWLIFNWIKGYDVVKWNTIKIINRHADIWSHPCHYPADPYTSHFKLTAKVKPDVCFSFRGNPFIFGWDITNFMFDLENSSSKPWARSNPMVTFEA